MHSCNSASPALQGNKEPESGKSAAPGSGSRSHGSFKYYILSFFAFFGIYASSSVCPFCGKPGCPVGVGGAVAVGGVLSTLWHYGRAGWRRLTRALRPQALPDKEVPHVIGKDR